jgi:hypothetical protein
VWKFENTNLFSKIFQHILSSVSKCKDELDLIKSLKNSLCFYVSDVMDQEEKPLNSFPLFPDGISSQIKKFFKDSPAKYSCFAFSCLQAKALCEEVPKEFIHASLQKHADQLSSDHRGISKETLELLEARGREFGKSVSKFYNPDAGFFPSNHASFEFPRGLGGVKGDLVFHDRLTQTPIGYYCDPDDRPEPFVIGLFGQPGMGKSVRINLLVSQLSKHFPGVSHKDLVYQRTCHVEHWDGYVGQPIVILDDLGQAADGDDIKEFQTLVSCCPYVLPMAHLDEKGRKFSSPVIITTSNLLYGGVLKNAYEDLIVIDDASFWRRFHLPLYVEKNQLYRLKEEPSWVRSWNLLIDTTRDRCGLLGVDSDQYFSQRTAFSETVPANSHVYSQGLWKLFPEKEISYISQLFEKRSYYHKNISHTWRQDVVGKVQDTTVLEPLLEHLENHNFTESLGYTSGTGQTKSILFPAYPPPGPLPVRVEPICEPLKVRIITAGIGDTFCLKPLQVAMWKALGLEPQFCLTHGESLQGAIKRVYDNSHEDSVWISGDYSAATDSFAIAASEALLKGILSSISHEPTKRWAMKEISPHLLVYPPDSGIMPVLQRSGQLMGSLLSFPLLCLLNDCTAKFSGLTPDQYLINGDDIIMRAPREVYPLWKEQVENFGLSLSLGKNYIHKNFGTVNSQFICDDTVLGSGKQRVLDRRSHVLGECLRDLELSSLDTDPIELKDLFKSVNRSKLSRTVRSISVPYSHGGLGFSWGRPLVEPVDRRTAKLCYLNDLFRKIKPKKGYLSVPYLSHEEKSVKQLATMEEAFNAVVTSKEYHEDFLTPVDLQLVQKRCMTHAHLRWCLLDSELSELPSLSFLRVYEIPFSDVRIRKELQKEIDSLFLERFLRSTPDFGYKDYRDLILQKTMGLKENMTNSVTHLVELMDLNVQPDFVRFLNLDYKAKEFSKKDFEGSLAKVLRPKEFNLELEDICFEDFSVSVVESYSEVLNLWQSVFLQDLNMENESNNSPRPMDRQSDLVSTDSS